MVIILESYGQLYKYTSKSRTTSQFKVLLIAEQFSNITNGLFCWMVQSNLFLVFKHGD